MTIREAWDSQADEFNKFDTLDKDEVENFADEMLAEKDKEIRVLCKFLSWWQDEAIRHKKKHTKRTAL